MIKRKIHILTVGCALAATLIAGIAVTACSSGQFEILTPAANATDVSTCPEITWTKQDSATGYHVEIASDSAYETVVREGVTEGLTYTVGNALAHATQYYLRVTALKEEKRGTSAIASDTLSFTTAEAHDTNAPDYTATRTLYDFSSFADSNALREEFVSHPDGNEIGVNLVDGGVDGGKAMEIDYTAGGRGWAGVMVNLPAEKKVWSGAKGIRMYVQGDGRGINVEVRIGKRGYQAWSAYFAVNNPQGGYVSIPFSAFVDVGGGDGIWDLAGITRFWLFFTGSSNSKLIIDDVTIGSDGNYTTDTRSEIEASFKAPAGVYENFDDYANDDEMEAAWTFENMGRNALAQSPFSTGKALELEPQSAWATARLNLPNYDFTALKSIRFKASAGTYVIQFETSLNGVFEKEGIIVVVDGEEAGVNIADLVPRVGTEGGVTLVRQLVIGVQNKSGQTVFIDDVVFSEELFTPKDYTPQTGVFDSFESYSTDADLTRVWNGDGTTLSLETVNPLSGTASLKATSEGWSAITFNYPNVSFDDVKSLRFKASAGTYSVRLVSSTWVSYIKEVSVSVTGEDAGVNIDELVAENGLQLTETVRQLYIGFMGSTDGILFDDFTYSDEEIVEADRTAGLIEDFEDKTDETISSFAAVNGATLSLETGNALSGSRSAKFNADGVFDFEINNAYFAKYDFTKTIGFEIAFRARSSAGNPVVTLQIGSWQNVYVLARQIYGSADNNVEKIVVMYDAMTLADGSSGALNKANINYFRIFVEQYDTDFTLLIDDVRFFTSENYAAERVTIDDFSAYSDDAALQAAWHANNVALENGAMKMTTVSGWNGLQYNFVAAGGIGSSDDFQNCYAVSLDVTASVSFDLVVKLQRWANAKETVVSVNAGTTHVVVYFSQLSGNDWSDMIFNYLTIGVTYYGVTDITIDNVEFLRG